MFFSRWTSACGTALDVNGRGTFAGSSNRLGEISRIQGQLMGEHSALSDLTASLDKQCKMLWDHLVSLQRKDQSVLANLESELGKRENTVSELGTMIHDVSVYVHPSCQEGKQKK